MSNFGVDIYDLEFCRNISNSEEMNQLNENGKRQYTHSEPAIRNMIGIIGLRMASVFSLVAGLINPCRLPHDLYKCDGPCPNAFDLDEALSKIEAEFQVSRGKARICLKRLQSAGLICPVSLLYLNGQPFCPDKSREQMMINPFVVMSGSQAGMVYARALWVNAVMRHPHNNEVWRIALAAAKIDPDSAAQDEINP